VADKDIVIGIDLGTTNSVVATVEGGQPMVLKTRGGANLTPSIVAVTNTGRRIVGQLAKRQALTNPLETVYASKRLIGRKFTSAAVQEAMKRLPYVVVCGDHDDVRIRLGGRSVALPEISAMILRELKSDAEAWAGQPVTKAVITVPAYFNDGQRQATKDAGMVAGLDVLRILNEPTAAALAYGLGKNVDGKIAVYDLGGGTFDISVLEMHEGVFEVIATGGDTYLGGEDYDHRVVDWLAEEFKRLHGSKVDLRLDRQVLQRLKDAAEKAKIDLSTATESAINLPFIHAPAAGAAALHLQTTLTRDRLNDLTQSLTQRTVNICEQVLREAHVRPADLKEVVLVGGMTRMPRVVEVVKHAFMREPCSSVNPDEVVALGAAVQAQALMQANSEVMLLDVTPMSLGLVVAGGFVRKLIPKNTTVPTSVTEVFNTARDGQTTVKIIVVQGESDVAHQNELLGEFTMTGLREGMRGAVSVEVTFEIDSEGIVLVSAKDTETGREQSIIVAASSGLTKNELVDIIDAQADDLLEAKADDALVAKRDELVRTLEDGTRLLASVRQLSAKTGFGGDLVTRADAITDAARRALDHGNLATIEEALDRLLRTHLALKEVLRRASTVPGN
jgi:molecular chaperone DnaK